jgi:AraC family transcriptional regulator
MGAFDPLMQIAQNRIGANSGEFSAGQTHDIALAEGSRIVLDSAGHGWKNIYAAISSQRRWSGSLNPIDHICFAYCLRRTATIERLIEGDDCPTVALLSPRQFGFIPTRVKTTFRLTGTADMMMIYLRGSIIEETAQRLFGLSFEAFEIRRRIGVLDPLLEQLMLEVIAALHRPSTSRDAAYIDEIAIMAIVHLLRHHADRIHLGEDNPPAGAPLASLSASLHRVKGYIETHLDGDLSLDALAREAGLSASAFKHAFAQAFDETPHQFIINRRVERTKQLLIGTNLPILEIALRTGFSSQSHCSDVFRRTTGETPRNYRRAGTSGRLDSTRSKVSRG